MSHEIAISLWGTLVQDSMTITVHDGATDEDVTEALEEALSERHISVGSWCGQGTALTRGEPSSYHRSTQADLYDPETGDTTTGQLWVGIDADDYEAAIAEYRSEVEA